MALPDFPSLVERLIKGSPLTHTEGDANLQAIRSFCVMLAELFGVALNPDGTLTADSVGTAQIQDRSITEAKLGPISVFPPKNDAGVTNKISISLTPAITAYQDGQVFLVYAAATNTGAATFKAASALAEIPIKKRGSVDLEAGDYTAGSLILIGIKGGQAHLMAGGSLNSSGGLSAGFSGFSNFEPSDVAIPPSAPVAASGTLSASANFADGDTVTIDSGGNQRVYRFKDTMAAAYDVQRHASTLATSLANLKAAIDASGTPGVEYFAGTLEHPTVSGGTLAASTLQVVADTAGDGGNSIVTTETSAVASWGGATLTGGISDSFVSLTHGFTQTPNQFDAFLLNIQDDLGVSPGVAIHVDNFTDSGGIPAFTTSANSSLITVERHPASIELGALGAIDTTKWLLRIRARIVTNASTPMFPALSFVARYPQGGFGDGVNLFWVGSGVAGGSHLNCINLATNVARRITPSDSGPNFQSISAAPFLRADGSVDVVFTSSTGIYRFPLLETVTFADWKPAQLSGSALGWSDWKPVQITESSGITKVYLLPGKYSVNAINSVSCFEITTSSGAAVAVGSAVDFTSALILNADGTPGNSVFRDWHPSPAGISIAAIQYNKVKKRIYVTTVECNLIHIFELQGSGADPYGVGTSADSLVDWWQQTPNSARLANLKYMKSISIPGGGSDSTSVSREDYYIDIDMQTGQERAIIFNRVGTANIAGSVTRAPWRE